MIELQRLTTEYIDSEDRIRLSGETKSGETIVIWLTRRLLDRLIPRLTRWLEKQHGDIPRADLILGFAQQAAESKLNPQARVSAGAESIQWLAQSIDIGTGKQQLHLTFKDQAGEAAGIGFSSLGLRQWLGILYQGYAIGRWTLDAWPCWMVESKRSDGESAVAWH